MRLVVSFGLAILAASSLQAQDRGPNQGKTVKAGTSGSSSDTLVIRVRDKCDPATFNANVGPGACVGDGNVTFEAFIAELIEDHKVGAWRFNPEDTGAKPGQQTLLESRAGELHTFTKVKQFGGGFIDLLNGPAGTPVPAPECLEEANRLAHNDFTNAIPAGAVKAGPQLLADGEREQKYQCCIHPWMRLTVTANDGK
jgi:hypothetical protein